MREGLRRSWHVAVFAVLGLPASSSLAAMTVIVERLADGAVRVDYAFDAAATELVFAIEAAAGSRAKYWTVLNDTLVLRDDRITSMTGSPFSAASVRIEPAANFYEAVAGQRPGRTALITLGARSSVIDLALVLPRAPAGQIALEARNAFDVRARTCVDEHDFEDAGNRRLEGGAWFVVVSTSRDACLEATHDGGLPLLAENAPADLQAVAARELASAYRRLAEKLGRPLDPPPTLILAHKPRSGSSVTGIQAGVDSVVVASLEGDSWVVPTPRQRSNLSFSLTQALAPSWFDGVVVPPAQPARVRHWLVGAPAQYLAALDRLALGEEVRGEPAGRMLLADIDLCSRRVEGAFGVARTAAVPVDHDPRTCGLLIQFVYDAITRAEAAGQRTIFDLWADVLREADGGPLEVESFLATNERARAVVAGLVYGPTADFEGIAAVLRNAGVEASLGEPRDTGATVAALLHVLVNNDCPEGLRDAGPFVGDRVKIRTRGTCRTLPQEVELIGIEGVGILTSARDVYRATADACEERRRVRLTGSLASQDLEIDCPASVPALPQQLYIRNVHFLN